MITAQLIANSIFQTTSKVARVWKSAGRWRWPSTAMAAAESTSLTSRTSCAGKRPFHPLSSFTQATATVAEDYIMKIAKHSWIKLIFNTLM